MRSKAIFDTSIYIEAIQRGEESPDYPLLIDSLPLTYLCSAVSFELYVGALAMLAKYFRRSTPPFIRGEKHYSNLCYTALDQAFSASLRLNSNCNLNHFAIAAQHIREFDLTRRFALQLKQSGAE